MKKAFHNKENLDPHQDDQHNELVSQARDRQECRSRRARQRQALHQQSHTFGKAFLFHTSSSSCGELWIQRNWILSAGGSRRRQKREEKRQGRVKRTAWILLTDASSR
jgi:hypothetical protein